MRELSLFTGAGGGILGSKLLGWKTVGYVEWEPYCQRVIRQRIEDGIFDNAPIFGDIGTFISEGYAEQYKGMVDAITGGFPCQPFSVAGNQLGENDPRNKWPETARCIRIIRPRIVYLENVAGLLTSGYFEKILCDLHEMGYNVRWCVLSAADMGAPHKRERLWILAYSKLHTNIGRSGEAGKTSEIQRISWKEGYSRMSCGTSNESEVLANSNSKRELQQEGNKQNVRNWISDSSKYVPNSTIKGLEREVSESWTWEHDGLFTECGWWSAEPGVGRTFNGMD